MLTTKVDISRFWSKVDKTGDCWEWQACRTTGYGRYRIGDKTLVAHRVAYELVVGAIPKGLVLDHLCRTRHCVNPKHLEAVTLKENVLRGVGLSANNARKTSCARGHEFNDDNTYKYSKTTTRACRICRYSNVKKHREKLVLERALEED